MAMLTTATATADGLTVCKRARQAPPVSGSVRPAPCRQRDAEQIPELAGEDDDGDAGGESDRHRIGNELDVGAEPQQPAAIRNSRPSSSRGSRRRRRAFDRHRHQHDEGAGGPADLKPAAAARREGHRGKSGRWQPGKRGLRNGWIERQDRAGSPKSRTTSPATNGGVAKIVPKIQGMIFRNSCAATYSLRRGATPMPRRGARR